MAKYFIHNGEQDSIIAELPVGYTVLEVNSAERSAAIDPLENIDVVGVPSIIEEIDIYKNNCTWNYIDNREHFVYKKQVFWINDYENGGQKIWEKSK